MQSVLSYTVIYSDDERVQTIFTQTKHYYKHKIKRKQEIEINRDGTTHGYLKISSNKEHRH
jgi:uncharacterized pyridoxamine 5'-phosphate oxidase family protein